MCLVVMLKKMNTYIKGWQIQYIYQYQCNFNNLYINLGTGIKGIISKVFSKTYIEFSTFLNVVSHTYVLNTNVLLSLQSV